MEITEITPAKGTRYTVSVDGEYWYILDEEIIAANQLQPGVQVTSELLDRLKEQAERRKAKERALYLLSYRDHSRGELVEKLCKSVSLEIAEETAEQIAVRILAEPMRIDNIVTNTTDTTKSITQENPCKPFHNG